MLQLTKKTMGNAITHPQSHPSSLFVEWDETKDIFSSLLIEGWIVSQRKFLMLIFFMTLNEELPLMGLDRKVSPCS